MNNYLLILIIIFGSIVGCMIAYFEYKKNIKKENEYWIWWSKIKNEAYARGKKEAEDALQNINKEGLMIGENVNLNSLKGKHFLSGVDFDSHKWEDDYNEDSNTMLFILDGITYEAIEDPDDGYRSTLGSLTITNKKVKNIFPKHEVLCVTKNKEYADYADYADGDGELIEMVDVITGKVVLEVGTDICEEYYPSCVMRWCPENLAINSKKERDEN